MIKQSSRCSPTVFVRIQTAIAWVSHARGRTPLVVLSLFSLGASAYAEPHGAYDPGMRALQSFFIPMFIWSVVGVLTIVSAGIVGAVAAPNNDPLPAPLDTSTATPPPPREPAPKPHRPWILIGFTPAILFSLCWLWLGLGIEDSKSTNYVDHMMESGLQVFAVSALLIVPPWAYLLFRLNHRPIPDNKRRKLRILKGILTAVAFTGANVAIVWGATILYGIVVFFYIIVSPLFELLFLSI